MLRMGGNCLPEAQHPALRPSVENLDWNREMSRLNSDASSLSAENCKDTFCCLAAMKLDDRTEWTDKKHNLYLRHLEVSFVKQLHQSKLFLARCSELNQRDTNISQKHLINVNNDSKQNGCWQKKDDLSRSNQADSRVLFKGKWMYNLKHMYVHCPPPSAEMPEFLKLCSTVKQGKLIIPHEVATGPQEFSTSNPRDGDLYDLTREGMGQNFSDEDNQSTSNYQSRAKRSRTALADSSTHGQIVPSWKCPSTDSSGRCFQKMNMMTTMCPSI
ncbi:hypothetical protein CDL12_20146 [Handroanthus impetiginosus]|uniref:Uncharacterized protein n=1 Tax=Handroanthus impetiginosus TaxID=429701 RepID=A0A2G9GPQ8_9LAMI|nr:hypothetical protein CDL12_20146 [Handroanthus impetiginosus]